MVVFVNAEKISDEEIAEEVEHLRPHYEDYMRDHGQDPSASQLREWARENLIERVLIKQEVISQGKPDLSSEALGEAVESLMEKVTSSVEPPVEDEIEAFYRENKDEFTVPEQVRAAHIVKYADDEHSAAMARAALDEIKKELIAGASFEELASQNSDCGDECGHLGWFGRGEMVPSFEDVVFSLFPGQVSDIVQTEYGFHIIKLYEKKEAGPVSMDEARDSIIEALLQEKRNKAIEDFVDTLKEKANIRNE